LGGNEPEYLSVFKCTKEDASAAVGGVSKGGGAPKLTTVVMPKKKTTLHVIYEEGSLVERRDLARGVGTVHQMELIHIFTRDGLTVPSRDRIKFPGTTLGDMLGPVAMPSLDKVWRATFRLKKTVFGTARVAVGGRSAEDEEGKKAKRELDSVEPVFYHAHGEDLWEELLHSIAISPDKIKAIVDFTPGDGSLAHVCVRRHIPYLGFVFTEAHAVQLHAWLVKQVWQDFKREGSELYQNKLVQLLEAEDDDEAEVSGGQEAAVDNGKSKAKAKGKAKGKAKSKAEAKAVAKAAAAAARDKKRKRAAELAGEGGEEEGESEPEDSMSGEE
jgi:hypothetical protein